MTPQSESIDSPSTPTAGQMLRAAREAQGLHLAVLSVKLKVSVRQLEALEADQHASLKSVAFVRALAQSVCRQLHIDPGPVLAALPQVMPPPKISPTPLQARHAPLHVPSRVGMGRGLSRQMLVLALLMLLGVAALVWWPGSGHETASEDAQDTAPAAVPMGQASDPQELPAGAASAEMAASAPEAVGMASLPLASAPAALAVQPALVASAARSLASAPAAPAVVAAASVPSDASLSIRLKADAWIEVRDSHGQMLVKRTVKAGEPLALSPSAPLFLYVSKADSAELRWQGHVVDLTPHTRNNEARLQLKP